MKNQGLCSHCGQHYVQGTWHQTFNDYRILYRPEGEALTPLELCPECPHKAAGGGKGAFLHGSVAVGSGWEWEGIMLKSQEQETRQQEEEAEMSFEG